tara:strand:- start:1213 stop:2457 length:1245 start_codon:yes stop_codon:yes gene_type:complete
MYTGSHLKLILTILIVPIVLIFLIASDAETRDFENEVELTIENISLESLDSNISIPEEKKLIVKPGDTFYSTLINYGVSSILINKMALDPKLRDFIRFRVNDRIYITIQDDQIMMRRFSNDDYFLDVLTIEDKSYKFSRKRDNLEKVVQYREFIITDSLYSSGMKSGVPDSVLGDLIYIFGWDIDYAFDIRNGDKVRILYEDIYSNSNGKLIANGDILAAEFVNRGEKISVIRFSQRGRKDYYTTDSTNVRKAFLRTPIEFARISSHYNPNRKHPILNTIRAHKGTDYAAKEGTEVVTTGDGIVKEAKFSSSYGNYIDIVHYNKYLTRYAHLKDFAPGIKKGSKVIQGQTIGYVGSTGLATGPHLHYEFHINGKHTDPVKVEPPNAQSINAYNRKLFDMLVKERTEIIANITSI